MGRRGRYPIVTIRSSDPAARASSRDPVIAPTCTSATFRRSPRLLGVLNTLVGLALAIAVAGAVSDLATRHFARGMWVLVAVLVVRWFVSIYLDEWNDHSARRVRSYWRLHLLDHFARPRAEGERSRGDLALAVERAGEAPALLLLEASAQSAVLGIAVIFWAVGWLSAVITIALLLLSVPLYRRAGRRSETLAGEYHRRRALLESRQLELLQHAPELRALGAVGYGAREIAAISDSEHNIALRAIRVALQSSLVTEFLSGVSIGLVAMVVGFALLDGTRTLFHALVAVLVTAELFVHVRRYGAEFHRREDAATSLLLLGDIGYSPSPRSQALIIATELVSEASEGPVNVTVSAGNRILVTGPSGSGKTTLLHTLIGWRTPRRGSVQQSGAAIGFVSPDSHLLSGSLRDNLTLGVDMESATVLARLESLGLVGERFDDLETPVLADGRGFSGGERVRLVLARCLLASPSLLVLDDVAGVLDLNGRDRVRRALNDLPHTAIIEATVDTPLLEGFTERLVVTA